ncbi:MAG TPA: metal ABC transporter permease [Geminicoccaceae bacterium]|nr:metal ABC transporter permease [Geminicoccaceae bacterium]
MQRLVEILALQGGYNTTLVCVGAALLGAAGGICGSFALLRKRSLVSDAASHATLPGVVLAFMAGVWLLGDGRHLSLLLLGAAASAGLGLLLVQWIRDHTRLPEDAAIATVLSVFYGLGMVLLSIAQTMRTGGQAGLEKFLLGSTAGMLISEAQLIALGALVVAGTALLFFKELGAICFDPDYARARGWNVAALDLLLLALMLAVVVVGLKTVGLVLVIAVLIIPPAAARFWTERLGRMVPIAAGIGALGSYLGAALSATAPDLPTGGLIVLTLAALFVVSLLLAPARGLLAAALARLRFRLLVAERQGLLAVAVGRGPAPGLQRRVLRRRGFLDGSGTVTPAGLAAARRVARDQRLWDRYLARRPEEATALAAWSLAPIETVLPRELIRELEAGPTAEATA